MILAYWDKKEREGKGREGKDGKGGQITTMMIRRLMDDG